MIPIKETPYKVCESCGKKMERHIFASKMESVPQFQKRRFCSAKCAHVHRIKEMQEKNCLHCGEKLVRKSYPCRLEDAAVFAKRKYCSHKCADAHKQKENPKKSAITIRCRKFKKDRCEECGTMEMLGVHHLDRNRYNNNPKNLKTLCASCHSNLHWAEDRKRKTPCVICGEDAYKESYCDKHYKRYAKYGNPLLSKIRVNGKFQVVQLEQ